MTDRYIVEEKTIGRIAKFGITFSRGTKFYNVVDKHEINDNIRYLYKYSAMDHCEYLNEYNRAERFIVCRDKNNVYWVFVKNKQMNFTTSKSYVKSISGVNYTKQFNSRPYNDLTELEAGCNSFKEAEELIQQMHLIYKKNINKYEFEIVRRVVSLSNNTAIIIPPQKDIK